MGERTQHTAQVNPFKFRELKVYNSTEYLWDNLKKYRQVFDRFETAYIYAEVSLHNKHFDEEEWSLHVELRCYNAGHPEKEICNLSIEREVSRYDPIVYLREGWGKEKRGNFWKAGTYYWEAYANGQKLGSKYFYIIDRDLDDLPAESLYVGPTERICDEYLELLSAKLYEGSYDDVSIDDRTYLCQFSSQETRYVYVELLFRNLQPRRNWHLEIFTKFKNQSRELKGRVNRLQEVTAGQETVALTVGWGAATPNLWRADEYTADIVFLDSLVCTVLFTVDDEIMEGSPLVVLPGNHLPQVLQAADEEAPSFESVMVGLDALIGLASVKQQVRDHAVYVQFLQLRHDRGFTTDDRIDVHAVFSGNPGTGKTTVARMMGRLYRAMGLLSSGHTVVADRVDLVGEYIGQTAPKTREVIESARGGVLFIDEAYSLARSGDDGKDFGREVIELLVKEMSDDTGDLAVIVAGYPEEMVRFLESNTGLKSRFKHYYDFPNFNPQELSRIADYAASRQGVVPTAKAKMLLDEAITRSFRQRDRTFGNARYVHDLVERAKVRMALRLMDQDPTGESLSDDALASLLAVDVLAIDRPPTKDAPEIAIDEKLLEVTLEELDQLVGMPNIKRQVSELVSLVRYYRLGGRDVLNAFKLHTVLVGNPGTGKTTVARLLATLYNALGILERGHIVETDRQGMVAGYVGQTAPKTAKVIEEAIGGVLFIDEAYALTQNAGSQRGDFGDEAVQTLLKQMEDRRGEFFVCVAGYPDNMEAFLKANPGLNSRFDRILKFEDYTAEELFTIATRMFRERNAYLSKAAADELREHLGRLHRLRDRYFGNARTVRQLVDDVLQHHDLRQASAKPSGKEADRSRIRKSDLQQVTRDPRRPDLQRKSIGF